MSITNFDLPIYSRVTLGAGGTVPVHFVRAPLVHVATSDEIAQTGFKYLFEIEEDGTKIAEAYVTANPADVGMIDLSPYIRERLSLPEADPVNGESIHSGNYDDALQEVVKCAGVANIYEVIAGEVYESSGTLTEFAGSSNNNNKLLCIHGSYPTYLRRVTNDASQQDLTEYSLDWTTLAEIQKGFLTRIDSDTFDHIPKARRIKSLASASYAVPVRETDYGLMAWIHDVTYIEQEHYWLQVTFFDSEGNQLYQRNVNTTSGTAGGQALNATDVDGKILATASHPKAMENTIFLSVGIGYDWDYYTLQMFNNSGGSPDDAKSRKWAFFKDCGDARFKPFQVAWDNGQGWFDYFTFNLKSEHEESVSKKNYETNIGSWSESTFKINPFNHGVKPYKVIPEKMWTVSTGKIPEATAQYLRHILKARRIDLIDENGSILPVILEKTSMKFDVDMSPKMREYSFTFKLAQRIDA